MLLRGQSTASMRATPVVSSSAPCPIRVWRIPSQARPGQRTKLILGPARAAAPAAEHGPAPEHSPNQQQVVNEGAGKEEGVLNSGEPAQLNAAEQARQEALEQMEVSTAAVNVDELAKAITRKCSTGPGLLIRCLEPRAVPPVLQALGVAGSHFASRLQVLPMARYNRSRTRLAEALEAGCGANFTVCVVPEGSQAQAPELPESQLRRVSSQGVAARLASVICADMREQQQCMLNALGFGAARTAFQAMILARMRLLFPPGSSMGSSISQATPPPMNFAVYPSVKTVQLEGVEGPSQVVQYRLLPHSLPNLQSDRYTQKKAPPTARGSQGRPPQREQRRATSGTVEVPIEEWAALKQSVELLSKQNRDLLELCTRALQSR